MGSYCVRNTFLCFILPAAMPRDTLLTFILQKKVHAPKNVHLSTTQGETLIY